MTDTCPQICDTEPRWYEWDISLYVRQQITKDMRAITIGLDVTPLTPELSQDDSYQSPQRVVFDGVSHTGSMPRLAFDVVSSPLITCNWVQH